jgi:hypothetical protein
MSYILKDTQALISTKMTDAGRQKLSQGKFNISFFQIGDSEIYYNDIPDFNYLDCNVLSAAYNAQNKTYQPEVNKGNVKYPYYVKGNSGNTYGVAIAEPDVTPIVNSLEPKGFFNGTNVNLDPSLVKNSQYVVDACAFCAQPIISLSANTCGSANDGISTGDFVTLVFDGSGGCGTLGGTPYPVLTYKVVSGGGTSLELDRNIPSFCDSCCPGGLARVYAYPGVVLEPSSFVCDPGINNISSLCEYSTVDVPFWNMNIPWKYNPAGVWDDSAEYGEFGSAHYMGSMEYLGYGTNSGQTFNGYFGANEISDSWYRNSFDEVVKVEPVEQKAVAIVHFTNNTIDTYYGEKLVMDSNFEVTLPTLMWHKNQNGTMGETFYVDPGVGTDTFIVRYMQSTPNPDMNDPGLRYYHLWDEWVGPNGEPNRVGKVFPDLKLIVFDDEEIVAALSYKSNRNWTLPAPKLSTLPGGDLLNSPDEFLWVTYRFNSDSPSNFTSSLHSNYYVKSLGPQGCDTNTTGNVAVNFGDDLEFKFLKKECCFNGYLAEEFYILAQIVTGSTTMPDPTKWKLIDFSSQLPAPPYDGSDITSQTYIINASNYGAAPTYNLKSFLKLPDPGDDTKLNFGDEYYFYGNVKSDITATIYEMKYKINLGGGSFTKTSNPSWVSGDTYITEVGLFDSEKDLMVTSKFQSPIKRTGAQQISISLDF